MNNDFIKHAMMYGDDGKRWLENIPNIIKVYEEKWLLKVLPPYELSYNYVAPAIQHDGSPAVLKIGMPQDKEFQCEHQALFVFSGDGSARLLKADPENSVILLEQVQPGLPLSTLENDEQATKILATVMKKLWKPLPTDHRFITITQWTQELRQYPNKIKSAENPPIPLDLATKAISLFDELITTSNQIVLTHADLHHDNVLSSNRDGWLAIDPKGIAAEPAYETAALIRNPYIKIRAVKNLEEVLYKRIMILSQELGFNSERIRKWCFAQTILSGVWTRDDADYTAHALRIARALDTIKT